MILAIVLSGILFLMYRLFWFSRINKSVEIIFQELENHLIKGDYTIKTNSFDSIKLMLGENPKLFPYSS